MHFYWRKRVSWIFALQQLLSPRLVWGSASFCVPKLLCSVHLLRHQHQPSSAASSNSKHWHRKK
jgi:hypothetical protein